MRVFLESNFFLLGPEGGNAESLEVEGEQVTLRQLLGVVSGLSPDSPEFFAPGGRDVSPGWIVEVNGNALGLFNIGLETPLKDGDRVSIKLELICGG